MRWLLVAVGIAAIFVFANSTGVSDRAHRSNKPLTMSLDSQAIEPAPLSFQPDIAPEDAEAINAARPDYDGPIIAAKKFVSNKSRERAPDLARATQCLAQAVYYEAASETTEGQRAVAQVVLNRVRDPRYPPSVCGVVFQGAERSTGCQFTFACDGSLARTPNPAMFERARGIAVAALAGRVEPLVGLATHYHTRQVVPYWRGDLVKLRTVGAHIFYGWQGRERSSRGLRASYDGIEPVIFPGPDSARPDLLPSFDRETDPANPFAVQPEDTHLSAPKLPDRDFGALSADENAGQLVAGHAGGLEADNQSGVLDRR